MKKILLSFLFCGALLSAAPLNVQLVDGGAVPAFAYGAAVGPYTLSVNGVQMPAMCMDDFLETLPGDTWTARQTSVTSHNLGGTYLGNGGAFVGHQYYSSSQLYTAEAFLFDMITKDGADRGNIQEAAWALMDSNTYRDIRHSGNVEVYSLVHTALDSASWFDASNFSIISKLGGHTEQEFMVGRVASAPEPASIALIGGGLLAGGVMRFRRKKVTA
jgi:hypothetical protein